MELTPEDDLLPEVPKRRGRPMRSLQTPFSRIQKGNGAKCRECPKYLPRILVCPVRGAHQSPDALACRYGHVLIKSKRIMERR